MEAVPRSNADWCWCSLGHKSGQVRNKAQSPHHKHQPSHQRRKFHDAGRGVGLGHHWPHRTNHRFKYPTPRNFLRTFVRLLQRVFSAVARHASHVTFHPSQWCSPGLATGRVMGLDTGGKTALPPVWRGAAMQSPLATRQRSCGVIPPA